MQNSDGQCPVMSMTWIGHNSSWFVKNDVSWNEPSKDCYLVFPLLIVTVTKRKEILQWVWKKWGKEKNMGQTMKQTGLYKRCTILPSSNERIKNEFREPWATFWQLYSNLAFLPSFPEPHREEWVGKRILSRSVAAQYLIDKLNWFNSFLFSLSLLSPSIPLPFLSSHHGATCVLDCIYSIERIRNAYCILNENPCVWSMVSGGERKRDGHDMEKT